MFDTQERFQQQMFTGNQKKKHHIKKKVLENKK